MKLRDSGKILRVWAKNQLRCEIIDKILGFNSKISMKIMQKSRNRYFRGPLVKISINQAFLRKKLEN